ncbi:MAG: hypothetical protein R3F08_03795 [Dokdonella sp.]|nr:hypothetical protein [Dokdonella sp.]
MKIPSSSDEFESLSRIAEAFGPYFFSLLFVSLSVMAYKWYSAATNRRPLNTQYANTCRAWFYCMGLCLLLTASVSIWWWIECNRPRLYTYQVSIADIPYEAYLNSEFHQRMVLREIQGAHSQIERQKRTFSFLIAQDTPFRIGQKFVFTLTATPEILGVLNAPGGLGKPIESDLTVIYSEPPSHSFRLSYKNSKPTIAATWPSESDQQMRTIKNIDPLPEWQLVALEGRAQ